MILITVYRLQFVPVGEFLEEFEDLLEKFAVLTEDFIMAGDERDQRISRVISNWYGRKHFLALFDVTMRDQALFWTKLFAQNKIRGHDKFLTCLIRGYKLFVGVFLTGQWQIFDYSDSGPHVNYIGHFNGATAYFWHVCRSFPGPVFP